MDGYARVVYGRGVGVKEKGLGKGVSPVIQHLQKHGWGWKGVGARVVKGTARARDRATAAHSGQTMPVCR